MKSGGEWISSVDLENHIAGLEGSRSPPWSPSRTPRWDERPVALVVRAPGTKVSTDEVRRHCAERFAKWQLPDDVLFRDALPLTTTGKIDKKAVRAGLAAEGYVLPELRTAAPAEAPGTPERPAAPPDRGPPADARAIRLLRSSAR